MILKDLLTTVTRRFSSEYQLWNCVCVYTHAHTHIYIYHQDM